MKYLRNQREKQIKFDIWEEEEEEDDPYMRPMLSKSEIYRLKQERKRMLKKNKKFIDKYPILNPPPPKKKRFFSKKYKSYWKFRKN